MSPSNHSASEHEPGHPLLEVVGLGRHFGHTVAVKDLSFSLRKGEVVGFLGPNGAGKSTTMAMLAGALAPSTGRVVIDGIDLLEDPLRARAKVGYLPEQPPLYRDLSVDEQLMFCAALQKLPRSKRAGVIKDTKARTGLGDSGRRIIGNLSKGYQQRVGIAQTLLHAPDVILLDEPTSGLDPNQLREIRALIVDLSADHAVMLSTHILGEVRSMCDRVVMLNLGEVVLDAPLQDAGGVSRVHVVRLRDPLCEHDRDTLGHLAGVRHVEALDSNSVRVEHDGSAQTVDAMVASLGTLGLRELRPEHGALEQLFSTLTQGASVVPTAAARPDSGTHTEAAHC